MTVARSLLANVQVRGPGERLVREDVGAGGFRPGDRRDGEERVRSWIRAQGGKPRRYRSPVPTGAECYVIAVNDSPVKGEAGGCCLIGKEQVNNSEIAEGWNRAGTCVLAF